MFFTMREILPNGIKMAIQKYASLLIPILFQKPSAIGLLKTVVLSTSKP